MRVRYGFIGCGIRSLALADAAKKSGKIDITAVCDIISGRLAAAKLLTHGAKGFRDYREMLAVGGFDAVVVAVPNDLHYGIARDALNAGYHVFCEKPIATELAQYNDLMALASTSDRVFHVGTELRFSPMMRAANDLVQSGKLGRVQLLWCKELRPPFLPGQGEWRLSPRNGGTLLEKNIHHFDLFNWYAGSRPARVSAFGGNEVIYGSKGILDNAVVNIEYENGIRAMLNLGLFNKKFSLEIGMLGDKGRVEMTVPPERLQFSSRTKQEVKEFERTKIVGRYDHAGEVEQHLAFVDAIVNHTPSPATLETALDAHRIAIAAHRSIAEGRIINLAEME